MPSLKYNLITKALLKHGRVRTLPLGAKGVKPLTLPLNLPRYLNVIYLGASIMDGTAKDSSARGTIEAALDAKGFQSTVYDKATSGWTTTDLLNGLNTGLLNEFTGIESDCLAIMHIGGNDVSSNGPYPGGASTLDANYRAIMGFLTSRGFNVMASTISYRMPGSSNPTQPYNENIIIPIIQEYTPWWIVNGVPQFDMYTKIFENQDWLDADGVHMTFSGKGSLRQYHIDTMLANLNPILDTGTGFVEDILVAFSTSTITVDSGFPIYMTSSSPVASLLLNSDGTVVPNGSISITNATDHSTGRVLATNTTPTLANSGIVRRGVYSSSIMFIDMSSAGLDPSGTYVVRLTSSRDSTDATRISEFVIDGVVQEQSAIANPPLINEFIVNGAALAASGITVRKKSGSPYCYINGLTIHKQP